MFDIMIINFGFYR